MSFIVFQKESFCQNCKQIFSLRLFGVFSILRQQKAHYKPSRYVAKHFKSVSEDNAQAANVKVFCSFCLFQFDCYNF